jgi:phosphate transport system permease protein
MPDLTTPAPPRPLPAQPPERRRSPSALGDVLFRVFCQGAAVLVIALAVSLLVTLVAESWPFFRAVGLEFLRVVPWNPGSSSPTYGGLALIYGTLVTSAIAMFLAVPLGVGTAAFLAEIAPAGPRRVGAFLVELLAAIPSVVYGLWGLTVFAPLIGGPGILAAGLVLAIMVVPYITAISFDVCRAVPRSQREGALALGATRWQMIRTAVLPYARPGIVAACFLALGRALGETMAVTMIIGNKALTIENPVTGVGDSIASVIANQLNEATTDLQRSGLVGLGLLLLLVSVAVNIVARLLIRRVGRVRRRAGRTHQAPAAAPDGAAPPAAAPSGVVVRVAVPPQARPGNGRAALADKVMTAVLGGCLVVTLVPLFLILGFIIVRGLPGLSWAFFTQLPAPPGEGGGLAHALVGSALMVGLATVIAVPFGILAAIYLAEYRSAALTDTVRFVGEILGGVPSIIIGIFSYALWVGTRQFSAWAGAFALGVMMIPIVLRTTEEALRLVPNTLRYASYALGANHWQTIVRVTLPAALPAVITGVFLAIARIAGETAPLLLTAYGSSFFPRSINDRTPFLPKYIYDYARSGFPEWEQQAWAAALVLVAVVMVLNVGIRLVTGSRVVSATRAD